jgi:hypothetical protein
MNQVGKTLDWSGFPQGTYSPCEGPQAGGDERRLTIQGVVVDFRKRNNMMYALIGREMGIPGIVLENAGDPKKNPFATGNPDTPATRESYRAGFDLSDGVTLRDVMRNRGRAMQEPNGWARREWPSWEVSADRLQRVQAAALQQLID